MATESLYNLPEDLKTIRVMMNLVKLEEIYPQVIDFKFEPEELESFIVKNFQGEAQSLDVTVQEHHARIEWRLAKAPGEAEDFNHQALQAAKGRDYIKAIELWRQAIKLYHLDPDFHYNLGLALFETKNFIKGLDRCKEALSICPIYFRAHFILGSIYSKQRQFDAAERHLQHGLLFQPNNVNALINLGAVNSIQKKYDSAIQAFENAISLSPKEAKAHLGLGKLYSVQQDFDNANRCYKLVVKLDPNGRLGTIAQNSLMNVLSSSEGEDFSKHESADRLFAKAHHSFLTSDYAAAEKYLMDYLNLKPRDANAWATAATCHLHCNHKEKSIHAIENAIKLSPAKASFYKQAGIIYDALNMPTEAGRAAQKAFDLGKQDSVVLTLLGVAQYKSDHVQDSIRILQEAVNRNPNNTKARYYFAKALSDLGQKDLAKQHFEEILWSQTASPLKDKARAELKELI
ncbi:MAG: tetratricopeptide repeat protein [Calditrichaeota bacterium]|nr:MAG: tetratricopeptide repeat protein [Calditrichota bacterium]